VLFLKHCEWHFRIEDAGRVRQETWRWRLILIQTRVTMQILSPMAEGTNECSRARNLKELME